jgi:predicted nucleic-acid-binding protein
MVEEIFVDTNVFLRFFVRDIESFYQKAKELFEKAEKGNLRLETNEMVIAEIVWVLESYYNFSRIEIKEVIDTIIETRNIKVASHSKIRDAIKLYASDRMDYIDAYNIVYIKAKDCEKVATFDKRHFKSVEGIKPIW